MTGREMRRAFRDYPVLMVRGKKTGRQFAPLKIYPYHEYRVRPDWGTIFLAVILVGALILAQLIG
ncbi:MAG: hypothetical protein LLF96_03135 [Eubacteriales bacterium]|nr:hypothetical protein [Eubacteriales bacterium]